MLSEDLDTLRKMKETIERIEEHALHLRSLGKEVPAVEKNARNILSTVSLLKFGVCDIVDIQDAQ